MQKGLKTNENVESRIWKANHIDIETKTVRSRKQASKTVAMECYSYQLNRLQLVLGTKKLFNS